MTRSSVLLGGDWQSVMPTSGRPNDIFQAS